MYRGEPLEPIKFTFLFLIFGLTMASLTVGVQMAAVKSLGYDKITSKLLGVKHELIAKSKMSIIEIHNKFTNTNKYKNSTLNIASNQIKLHKGVSMFSFGETIIIEPINGQNSDDLYRIRSKPKFIYQLCDNGVNLKNVLEIKEQLTRTDA